MNIIFLDFKGWVGFGVFTLASYGGIRRAWIKSLYGAVTAFSDNKVYATPVYETLKPFGHKDDLPTLD